MIDYDNQIKNQFEGIKNPENKKKVLEMINEIKSNVSKRTILMKMHYLKRLSNFFENKKFEDLTKEDLVECINAHAEGTHGIKPLSNTTLNTMKAFIKSFYVWLESDEDDKITPKKVRWMRPAKKEKELIHKDMFSWDEIITIAKSCKTFKEKACTVLLYDSGTRAAEFLGLKIGDVIFDGKKNIVNLNVRVSKTYARNIAVERSSLFLKQYLSAEHPASHDPWAPLFFKNPSRKTKENSVPMDNKDLINLLSFLAIRAGIKKYITPKLFRHSRAFEVKLYNTMHESQMRFYFGWDQESTMPSYYGAMVDKSMMDDIIANEFKDKKQEFEIPLIKCPVCAVDNHRFDRLCFNCGKLLDEKEREQVKNKDDKIRMLVEQNKKMMEKFEQVKELIKTSIAFVDALDDDEKNTVFVSQAGDEKLRPREWYQENWNVNPEELPIKHYKIANRKDRSGATLKMWSESDVLPFS